MLVSHASLTRSPFSPSSTASAACWRSTRSAVNRNRAELASVQTAPFGGVDLGSADVLGGVGGDASVDVRESVEAAHGRESSVDRRRGETALFHVVPVQLDVRTGRVEHVESRTRGPTEEAAQILPVRLERASAVAGQERDRGELRLIEHLLAAADLKTKHGVVHRVHVNLP